MLGIDIAIRGSRPYKFQSARAFTIPSILVCKFRIFPRTNCKVLKKGNLCSQVVENAQTINLDDVFFPIPLSILIPFSTKKNPNKINCNGSYIHA